MIVGALLAGGRGRRMGGEKALVELDGRPLLHYPLDALRAVVAEVAVVCKPETPLPHLPPDVAIWCDDDPRHHPLVGVAAALRCARGRTVLVCAGDLPLLTPDALRALRDAPPCAVAVARCGGRLQPLLARYAPEALAALTAMEPDASATSVVAALDPVVVDLPDERVAFNVNAPEDLLYASALLRGNRPV